MESHKCKLIYKLDDGLNAMRVVAGYGLGDLSWRKM